MSMHRTIQFLSVMVSATGLAATASANICLCWGPANDRQCKEFTVANCSHVNIPAGSSITCYNSAIAAPGAEGNHVSAFASLNGSVVLGTVGSATILATPSNSNVVIRPSGSGLEFSYLPDALDLEVLGPVVTGITLPGHQVTYPEIPSLAGQTGGMCVGAGSDFCIDFTLLDPVTLTIAQVRITPIQLSGLVFQPLSQVTSYCFGDGGGNACPCGNSGATGYGCANSVDVNGGNLALLGTASLSSDSLVLVGSSMPNSSCLYFQGTSQVNGGAGAIFGDGLRCAGGTVIRLGTKSNAGGTSQYPSGADPLISIRGAVAAPSSREYQAWYRNAAAFCAAPTFNLTNGLSVTWTP